MPDNRMFAQLIETAPVAADPVTAPKTPSIKHVSLHLTETQVAVIDRYFTLLYGRDPRPTRSAIVGVALEVLDDALQGHAPQTFDRTLLGEYVRRQAGTPAGMQVGAQAPKHRGAYEP